jgi:hypothetical protein
MKCVAMGTLEKQNTLKVTQFSLSNAGFLEKHCHFLRQRLIGD